MNGAPGTGCAPSVGFSCDDGLGCTIDLCDEVNNKCSHAVNDAACNNNISCDGVEVCSLVLGCISVNPPSCDDGITCTNDFCDLASDSCSHVSDDSKCQNGLFCDGVESCDPVNGAPMTGCVSGTPIVCSDGIACTQDACSEAVKGCLFAGNDAFCDNGVFCDGAEICMAGQGCSPGIPLTCDDNRACTADSCSEAQKSCLHVPNNAVCDNGQACDGQEVCSVNGPQPTGCMTGAPFPCPNDGIACTVEVCNEGTDTCEHLANNQLCSLGLECNVAQGGCVPPPSCFTNADCVDQNLCDGMEACVNGQCVGGMPIDCDDGFGCTVDACDPATGQCSNTAQNAFCSDPFSCNGIESCDPANSPDMSGCVQGQSVNCDDGIGCTADGCQEPFGTCAHVPQNFLCSDAQLCNGVESCDPANSPNATGCVQGPPTVCADDGIACTTAACDPMLNACVTTINNAACPCGQTCNPAQGGCGNFCTVSTCQGKVYACGDCIDNDGDCKIDSADEQCLGPCDNTEDSFYGGIPGQNNSPCKSDCYFDQDTGSGNDDCYWSHKCDPLEVGPDYPPEGSQCSYNPNASIPGYGGSCTDAFNTQSQVCTSYCGPLTPNGCDCFGCCVIPGAPTTVWLGSENPAGTGSCNINTVNDPSMCKPCTQVAACINTCEICEVCIGKPDLPPQCTQQECDPGVQLCGQVGQAPCAFGYTCITGCCILNP